MTLVLSLVAATAATGCGSSSTEGITSTSVTIGGHTPLSGPAAPGYDEIAPAASAFFRYLNARGGVNGRKIHYIYRDDAYNPSQTVAVTRRLVLRDKVFAIFNGLGTPTHAEVLSFLNSSKVPDLFVASGCPCWDDGDAHPYTFGWQPSYEIEGKLLGRYIARRFAGEKVGVLYQDDDFGQSGLAGVKQTLPASQLASTERYAPDDTSLTAQLQGIRAAGARVLVEFTLPVYTALAQLTARQLGYGPQLVISSAGSEPTTVGRLIGQLSNGQPPRAPLDGAVTDTFLPPPGDTSNRWIRLFGAIHDRYDRAAPFDGNVVYGMAAAYTFAQALRAAGRNPTRASIVHAVEAGLPNGPALVPARYSRTDHGGLSGAVIAMIEGGRLVLAGG